VRWILLRLIEQFRNVLDTSLHYLILDMGPGPHGKRRFGGSEPHYVVMLTITRLLWRLLI